MTKHKVATKKTKKKRKNTIPYLIMLIGLIVLCYPLISRWYYRIEANEQVLDFQAGVDEMEQAEIDRRLDLAHAYNEAILNGNAGIEDPYDEQRLEQGIAEYARMLEIHEKIGIVEIPKINEKLPIYAGTAEEVLQKGTGHLEGTSLPVGGNNTHAVITAHSGLPEKKLFTDLEKLEIGDKFYIHNIGGILAYQVNQIKVIDPTDFSDLLIQPGHDYVTLLTCTPTGINTHRLIVRGHQVPYVPEVDEKIIAENKTSFMYRYLFYISLVLIIILLLIIRALRRKKRQVEKSYKNLKDERDINKPSDQLDQINGGHDYEKD